MIPKPFAHVRIEYLPPRRISRDAGRGEMEALAAALGEELDVAGARLADALVQGDGRGEGRGDGRAKGAA
jgi:hypothetical protein